VEMRGASHLTPSLSGWSALHGEIGPLPSFCAGVSCAEQAPSSQPKNFSLAPPCAAPPVDADRAD